MTMTGKQGRSAIALLATVFVVTVTTTPVSASAHQTLWWNEGGSQFARFGANAAVTIYQGTATPDTCDDIFPATDLYVVATSSLADDQPLKDVSNADGLPNTVFLASGGLFAAETVAFTARGGFLGSGTYGIVYDECQDAKFDADVDRLFFPAFEVSIPADPPPIDPLIVQLKSDARGQAQSWQRLVDTVEAIELLLKIKGWYECGASGLAGCALSYLSDQLQDHLKDKVMGELGLTDPKEAAKKVVLNTIKHYGGIAADPPDPAFDQLSPLGPVERIVADSDDPVVTALVAVGNAEATESELLEALLHSIERYQGADAKGDGTWALAHAEAVQSYAVALGRQLVSTNAALSSLSAALTFDGRDLDQLAQAWNPIRGRIAFSGFNPDELRHLQNRGLTPSQIETLRIKTGQDASFWNFSEQLVQSGISSLISRNDVTRSHLTAMASDAQVIVDALLTDPAVAQPPPHASAGGPYTAAEGVPIPLDGSGSTDPDGTVVAFAWDLDGDGQFDDAVGASLSAVFDHSFDGLVGLEVSDDSGRKDVAYARVTLTEANRPPVISGASPSRSLATVTAGGALPLSVAMTDPDGDPVTVRWFVDYRPVAEGETFEYRPDQGARPGLHVVRAEASDGRPSGGSAAREWGVSVLAPDGDGDGWTAALDCDDATPAVHPSRTETLENGRDDDCDAGSPDTAPGGVSGSVWSWGANPLGGVGNGAPFGTTVPEPVQLAGQADVVQIHSYFRGGLARRTNGEVLVWGSGLNGELGNGKSNSISGSTTASNVPIAPRPVGGGDGQLSGITEIQAEGGNVHVVARRADGTVVAWGDNQAGQLGDGTAVAERAYPMPVLTGPDGPPLSGVAHIEVGYNESHAIMSDGSVRTWGMVRCNGGPQPSTSPFPVPLTLVGTGVKQLSSASQWNLFLKADGSVLSCGRPATLGRPSLPVVDTLKPLPVIGLGPGSGVVDVSAGAETGLVLKGDGTVWTWGRNDNGSLDVIGVPRGQEAQTPRQVPLPPGPPVVDIEQDSACHSMARRADGSVLVWGCNFFRQTGVGSGPGAITTPTLLNLPGADAIAIAASVWNGLALTRPHEDSPKAPPVLAPVGSRSVDEGVELVFTAMATDPDAGETLRYSIDGAPLGAVIDPATGVFRWTPTEEQGPGTYPVTVRVTDGTLMDDEQITVAVGEVNRAPVMAAVAPQTIDAGSTLTLSTTASDADVPSNRLTYALVGASPEGASIDATSGAFSWTPGERQGPGPHTVTVRVVDDGSPALSDETSFTVDVRGTNRPPVVRPVAPQEIAWGDRLEVAVVATDEDIPVQRVTFSLTVAPPGASIDPSSGVVSWIPTAEQLGRHILTVRATDNGVPEAHSDRTIDVSVGRRAAVVAYTGDATGRYSDSIALSATLADAGVGPRHGMALADRRLIFRLGSQSAAATTDARGRGEANLIVGVAPGRYDMVSSFDGDALYLPSHDTDTFTVEQDPTRLVVTGPATLADGRPITLEARLTDDDGTPVSGRLVTLTLGSQNCAATTDAAGVARCAIPVVHHPLGPSSVTAAFTGDAFYTGHQASLPVLVYALTGGTFVVGDKALGPAVDAVGRSVTFWDSDWSRSNPTSGSAPPASFKGYADAPGDGRCGQSWTSSPGNSGKPPETVPSYVAVVISGSISKSGPALQGDVRHVVVIRTDPGYEPNPGHQGTGTVVAVIC